MEVEDSNPQKIRGLVIHKRLLSKIWNQTPTLCYTAVIGGEGSVSHKQHKSSSKMYTVTRKILLLTFIFFVSTVLFGAVSVACYFIVGAIVPEKPNTFHPIPDASQSFNKAAVASNGHICAKIGKDTLQENGTAVDAALATLICEGVTNFQSMGIGGGFLMTIYDKKSGKVEVLNARETAPLKSHENMFEGNATLSTRGGLAVAIPSELRGYHEAYLKYGGGVPWKRLFEPSIKICREGYLIQKFLASHIQRFESDIYGSPTLRELLINQETGKLFAEGDLLKRPKLGDFLEIIANNGIDTFYSGDIAKKIVEEVREAGGILTEEDLKSYKVEWTGPVEVKMGSYKMYSSPLPGSGHIVAFILNILRGFQEDQDERINAQRITESFKWGYGKRTELGDIRLPEFVPNITEMNALLRNLTSDEYATTIRRKIKDDVTSQDPEFYEAKVVVPDTHGTSHISVISEKGDAVSATSTINTIFGSMLLSKSTGILYNNEMDDFSAPHINNAFGIPPSPANFIKPGKRPLSSMCPTIFLNEANEVELIVGGSGGTRITSAVVNVAFNKLWRKKSMRESIELHRIHHQLFPMEADVEAGFRKDIVDRLKEIGHKIVETSLSRSSSVTAIGRKDKQFDASYDYRRGGSVAGY